MNPTSGADGPEDVDATFERIVADLRAEGLGADADALADDPDDDPGPGGTTRDVDGDDDVPDGTAGAGPGDRSGTPRRGTSRRADGGGTVPGAGAGWRETDTDWDDTLFGDDPADDDEHFVPPEPPPLPRPRKGAFVVLLFFVVGILLLAAPGVFGLGGSLGLPLGLLAVASGIALALLRVRQGPPDGADPDNGAQV
ncbi:hypothetical protein [Saccharomonospora iraqiensis]|uniref:hypothetical protein n=1 Tax=Saccharomonospora iraqiensis TaxID=52698 RepID=UPI00022DED2B|nr:hypothetical protein [Saccharomonospora iraqiensis]